MFCTVNLYFLILENYWNAFLVLFYFQWFFTLKCFFITAAEVQRTTLIVKRAFQNHRKYICSLTCRFCHLRVFLFLSKLFWTSDDVTLISILTQECEEKCTHLPSSESWFFETWQKTRLYWTLVQKNVEVQYKIKKKKKINANLHGTSELADTL